MCVFRWNFQRNETIYIKAKMYQVCVCYLRHCQAHRYHPDGQNVPNGTWQLGHGMRAEWFANCDVPVKSRKIYIYCFLIPLYNEERNLFIWEKRSWTSTADLTLDKLYFMLQEMLVVEPRCHIWFMYNHSVGFACCPDSRLMTFLHLSFTHSHVKTLQSNIVISMAIFCPLEVPK